MPEADVRSGLDVVREKVKRSSTQVFIVLIREDEKVWQFDTFLLKRPGSSYYAVLGDSRVTRT